MDFKNIIYGLTRIKSWWKLSTYAAAVYLVSDRDQLMKYNLHDMYKDSPYDAPNATCYRRDITARTLDGSCNNLEMPGMGMLGYRMGRNIPFDPKSQDILLYPNPREVSRKLLIRDKFIPATSINLLAAAWIQFQAHDWFNHDRNLNRSDLINVPLPNDDPWRKKGVESIKIPRTVNDSRPGDDPSRHPTHPNSNTHWWDLSQVYGTTLEINTKLRSFVDGKLKVDERNHLEMDVDGMELVGFKQNWWLGLSMMHTIFTREHNSVCDHLKRSYPNFTDQELYDKARLVTSALNAKIHTLEWTPSVLQDDVGKLGDHANWYGLANIVHPFLGKIVRLFKGTLLPEQAVEGIVGGKTVFENVPFSLTEEFAAVYRFHSLLPDEVAIVSARNGLPTGDVYPLLKTAFKHAPRIMHSHPFKDIVASFGTAHPGALTLNNFPAALTNFTTPYDRPQILIDLATTDIVRDRERGIPRYNAFRRSIWLKPMKSFEDINPDPAVVSALKAVYDDVEDVDLLIGCMAETPRPGGWAFGDTAFHIFLFMAPRRLMTDRFLTEDFNAETYTEEGLKWVKNNGMKDVILRAEPSLAVYLDSVDNPFLPWVHGKVLGDESKKPFSWGPYLATAFAGAIVDRMFVKMLSAK